MVPTNIDESEAARWKEGRGLDGWVRILEILTSVAKLLPSIETAPLDFAKLATDFLVAFSKRFCNTNGLIVDIG